MNETRPAPGPSEAPPSNEPLTVGSSIRVLFVCTGNSARSQMAEALLRRHGGPAFEVTSAGTEPKAVHPFTLETLAEVGIDHSGARSKSVSEFFDRHFDYVITVCDRARESCPVFPGVHRSLHWGFDDPAAVEGTDDERRAAFRRVMSEIQAKIRAFVTVTLRDQRGKP
jgi:arsenate reductase (thioredoxin)